VTEPSSGFVLDHVFVFCRPGAPEAARLEAAGLRVGVRREHPGQGTANVCFCFADCYLEFIWIADADAAYASPLALADRARWRDLPTSPFGICLRPTGNAPATPFPSFDYAPAFLPAGMPPIRVAANARGAAEPLLFALHRDYAPPAVPHVLAQSRLRRARCTVPGLASDSPLRALQIPAFTVEDGAQHHLELAFDASTSGATVDLRPELPLFLRW
jgi:Glyoxalase-like domain